MQMLNPLTLMKIGALSRHVLHVPRIHQTRFDAVLLDHWRSRMVTLIQDKVCIPLR